MSRGVWFTVFGLAPLATVCVTVLLFVAPALAGRPAPGAHYFGLRATAQYPRVEELIEPSVELRVARSGRRLSAAEVTLLCGRGRSHDEPVVSFSFRHNPAAVVRRDGSFSFPAVGLSDTKRPVRLWLSGRFVSAQYARLFYRVRNPRDCPRPHERYRDFSPAALYRDGQPPFSGCRSQRAGTLLRTDTARVFQQLVIDEFTGFVTHVYACLYAKPHRRVDLGQNYDDGQVRVPRLAGKLLAYSGVGCALGGCQATITVRDLGSGRVIQKISPVQDPFAGPNLVWDLALKEDGSLAWIVAYGRWGERDFLAREVWALDTAGQRLLDSGPGLELESLALTDSTLTWLHGGIPRSATLN